MKSTLIRILTIMTLATSISAFALPREKPAANKNCNDANAESTSAPSPRTAGNADKDEQPSAADQEKSERQRLIEKQNKQWLHDLQGMFG